MGTPAAPRIDDRLRQFVDGSPVDETAAELTRRVGALAWQLGLARPSYQQIRVLRMPAPTSGGRVIPLRTPTREEVYKVISFMYEYPAPGLAGFYERYKHGRL